MGWHTGTFSVSLVLLPESRHPSELLCACNTRPKLLCRSGQIPCPLVPNPGVLALTSHRDASSSALTDPGDRHHTISKTPSLKGTKIPSPKIPSLLRLSTTHRTPAFYNPLASKFLLMRKSHYLQGPYPVVFQDGSFR